MKTIVTIGGDYSVGYDASSGESESVLTVLEAPGGRQAAMRVVGEVRGKTAQVIAALLTELEFKREACEVTAKTLRETREIITRIRAAVAKQERS